MFSSKLHAAILAIAFTIGAGAAHATTITFDELPLSDQIGMPVGTDFATGGYNFNLTDGVAWIMAARADGAHASNGTTSLDLGGMVTVTLKGSGELARVVLDESLVEPGEGEVIADLIVAAHADAKKKLDAQQAQLMQEAAGPMAGLMGGMPGMKF